MTVTVARLNRVLDGRYGVEGHLGDGPMASVFAAVTAEDGQRVALRVLRPEVTALVGAESFLSHLEPLKALRHPGLLSLLDSGETDGLVYYVVPRVDGETLRERLRRVTRFPVEEAVGIAVDIADTLDYAHGCGYLHGDLKPANILFHGGAPKLSSFGVVQAVGRLSARLIENDLSLGTPYYMSPERAVGGALVGPTSEVYSLGAILYEMLVGAPPFVGPTAPVVLGEVVLSQPVPPLQRRPQMPANLDAAIQRSLEKLPENRFQTCAGFAGALRDPSFTHGGAAAEASSHRSSGTSTELPPPGQSLSVHTPAATASRGADGTSAPEGDLTESTFLYADRLMVKEDEGIRFISVDDIRFVESERNYLRIHTDVGQHLVRRRIGELELQLDPKRFKRIHRSTIVNLDSVDRLVPWFSGGYLVHLHSGEELKLSRGYASKLFGQVGKTL